MKKSSWFHVPHSVFAFWYCNRAVIILSILLFVVGALTLALSPGMYEQRFGILAVAAIGIFVIWRDIPHEAIHPALSRPEEELKREIHLLWFKEEPPWSRPVMIALILVGWSELQSASEFFKSLIVLSQ